ncbi:transposase, partial [Faecalicatena contorta]|uniref:transposase n=1 Tax=Faecalicatena contorta TaxID=39482 RepID=UPI001960BA48
PAAWVVDCKAVGDGRQALLYLGRYLYRGVVQERDILRCDEAGRVTFRYRDAKTDKVATRTLPGADFLWLVLQHVLPKGLRRARNFGFLHPNSAGAIRLLQVLHLRAAPFGFGSGFGSTADTPAMPTRPLWRCACGQPMHVVRRRMPAMQMETPPPPPAPSV